MGLFSLSGEHKEQKTQLHFYDDHSFEFRKRPVEDSCLVEKQDNNIVKAWKHFYGTEMRFDGYGKLKPDGVTLSFDRDFIFDPFNKVPDITKIRGGKPLSNEGSIKAYCSSIAEGQRYKVMNKPGNMLLINKITLFLGAALVMEILLWGAMFVINRY